MTQVVADIGVNHNGDIRVCKQLIAVAAAAGCEYASIDKHALGQSAETLDADKNDSQLETPWGSMSRLDYVRRLDFTEDDISDLLHFADDVGITLFMTVWDVESVELAARHVTVAKIPCTRITDAKLCKLARARFSTLIVSTGMATEDEIAECVHTCKPDVLFHTNSTVPCHAHELNLNFIPYLAKQYPACAIGYSGAEAGLATVFGACTMGARWIERRLTLNRNFWGADHMRSMEPDELFALVRGIRALDDACQYQPGPRMLFDRELEKRGSGLSCGSEGAVM